MGARRRHRQVVRVAAGLGLAPVDRLVAPVAFYAVVGGDTTNVVAGAVDGRRVWCFDAGDRTCGIVEVQHRFGEIAIEAVEPGRPPTARSGPGAAELLGGPVGAWLGSRSTFTTLDVVPGAVLVTGPRQHPREWPALVHWLAGLAPVLERS